MKSSLLFTVMSSVFFAELGDKTQIATIFFAAGNKASKLVVFTGASLGLILACAVGVFAGSFLAGYLSEKQLNIVAGIGFLVIGAWTLLHA